MIPVSRPSLGALERRYLLDAFDSGWISSRGPYVVRAEEALCELTGAPFAAVVSNGTVALHLALLALGVGPGDEVVIPSLTYVATLNAVLYVGATPVIVDVDPDTWCISPEAVDAALGARTAAVLAVDLFGHPANYPELRRFLEGRACWLVADAAESIGGHLGEASVGTLADVTTFSFFGNKVITSGEGGAVVTADPALNETVMSLRNQGNHSSIRYFHDRLGYNYRMTNVAAAVLTGQLERADELIERRQSVVDGYRRLLAEVPEVTLQAVSPGAKPSPWLLSIVLEGATQGRRDEIMRLMANDGVEVRPVFAPVQEMPYLSGARALPTPVAKRVSQSGLSLPTFPDLSAGEVEEVVASLSRSLLSTGH